MQEPKPARKPATVGRKLMVMCLSLVLAGFLLEVGVRLRRGGLLSFENVRKENFEVLKRQPAMYDATLGYVPEPGRHEEGLDFVAHIDAETLRMNGQGPRPPGRPLLATGDSFTFGDQVDDEDTWPARLELELGRPVLNGGVFGYGVDQIVLRAEQLLEKYEPSVLIVSMIEDDVRRAEMSYRYAWKPYFRVVDGELELCGVPVPEGRPPVKLLWLRDALSYSYLADAVLGRVAREWWLTKGSTRRMHDDGLEVARLLMGRLAARATEVGTHVLVVSQCDRSFDHAGLAPVLESARQAGMDTLDLSRELAELAAKDPSLDERFYLGTFGGHMSPAGNAWVAERIAEELRAVRDRIDW